MQTASPGNGREERIVRVAEALSALPAVATLDWADLAADAFARLGDGCRIGLMIARFDEGGRVVGQEATGAGASPDLGTPQQRRGIVLSVRSGLERAPDLGPALSDEDRERGVVELASRLIGESWSRRGVGAVFPLPAPREAIVAVAQVGEARHRRAIVVMLGLGAPRAWGDDQDAAAVRACLPLLVGRALLAIGPGPAGPGRWLTAREQLVLEHLTLGRSVREIADALGRSQHTVHDHVKSLHRKLAVRSRGELVARALGYIDDEGRVLGRFAPSAEATAEAARAELAAEVRGDRPTDPAGGRLVEPKPAARITNPSGG